MTKELIIKQLKEKGLRVTPQRLAIIEVLIEKRDLHPGARLVYEEAKKKKKSLSLSTTYATLNELSRHGIIKTLQFDRIENRYEGNLEEHINLICERCNKILDYKISVALTRGRWRGKLVSRSLIPGWSTTIMSDAKSDLLTLLEELIPEWRRLRIVKYSTQKGRRK